MDREPRNQSPVGSNYPLADEQGKGYPQPPQGQAQKRPTMDNLTEEERQLLKECERDSFYYRALPMSAGAMVGVQYLVKTGRLAPHPKLGAGPKAIIFGCLGYMIGKISYLPICRQKILDQIPNSKLAATIRGKPTGTQPQKGDARQWEASPPPKGGEDYSAFNQNPSAFTESSVPSGIDDRFRPTVDKDSAPGNAPEEGQKRMTYEEMRRRNRQQYEESKAPPAPRQPGAPSYKDSPLMPQKPWPSPHDRRKSEMDTKSSDTMPSPPPSQGPTKKKRTNIWGDDIDE